MQGLSQDDGFISVWSGMATNEELLCAVTQLLTLEE
jgi:hypothetical protein